MSKSFKPGDRVITESAFGVVTRGIVQSAGPTFVNVKQYNGETVRFKPDAVIAEPVAEQVDRPYGVGLTDETAMIRQILEGKSHTVPKTAKEKDLAALAEPKGKITHKDVLVGRGVLTKEEEQCDQDRPSMKARVGLEGKPQAAMEQVTFTAEEIDQMTDDQVDLVNEVLSKSAPAGKWISDFVNSDNPKFAGKSKAERKRMALGAYYAKQNEEVDLGEQAKWRQGYAASGHPPGMKHSLGIGPVGGTYHEVPAG